MRGRGKRGRKRKKRNGRQIYRYGAYGCMWKKGREEESEAIYREGKKKRKERWWVVCNGKEREVKRRGKGKKGVR